LRHEIISHPAPLDKKYMRRGLLMLSGLLVLLCGAALVQWAAGYPPILPWPILLVVAAIAGGSFVITLLRDQGEAIPAPLALTPSPSRVFKKHRPRGKAKKRVTRNAFKRRRTRKAGGIFISHDADITHDGSQQVGFFG
jgi:hypothetical protein